MMRRILLVLMVGALMVAMLVASAMPAFADPPPVTGEGSNGQGAIVQHCGPLGELEGIPGFKGNVVFTPSGNFGGSDCRF